MDLWDAGQRRIARENRDRLAELYTGVRDGVLAADVAVGRAKPVGTWKTPAYLPATEVQRSPESRDAALAKLGRMIPGIVRRSDS